MAQLFIAFAAVGFLASGTMVSAQKAGKAQVLVNGIVKSVSGTSLTVTANNKDTTFTVDPTTSVVGKGIGTKSREKGGKPMITDLIKEGARVSVTYHDTNGTMHASKIDVLAAAR
jgi:hypothetical protein